MQINTKRQIDKGRETEIYGQRYREIRTEIQRDKVSKTRTERQTENNRETDRETGR